MKENEKQIDVRIVTLKRWNLPQSRSLYQIWKESGRKEPYGEYISFQNYHFIDITPVQVLSSRGIFPAAYKAITEARQRNEREKNKDIYIQQSIVIYGNANEFWASKPEVLYLTMLQLTNRLDLDMPALQRDIQTLFQANGVSEDQWALYYSLDFCDLILFVRDIPQSIAQNVLWNLAPVRCGALGQIRDTVTVYGLNFRQMMESFDRCTIEGAPGWERPEDTLSLSVSLGVRKLAAWVDLKQKIDYLLGVQSTYFRIPGRYDVQVVLENMSFSQMLQVLWWIDCACGTENNDAFGCYEAVPLDHWKKIDTLGQLDQVDTAFQMTADQALEKLLQVYTDSLEQAGELTRGYAAEIRRALTALLANGFSEEFVLSVFYSFTEYLRFVSNMMEKKSCKEKEEKTDQKKREHLYAFQYGYLQALNMLAHCTMHSERQFIQAPAFNAVIFDIPPKLLAFYAGVAYKVTELLNDEERTYSFLFSPDFRPDIRVRPISGEGYHNKLLIIYINEWMFYDPTVVIQTMCHEIAHHVGNKARHRKQRAEFILECIGGYLIYAALPIQNRELVEAMARVIQQETMKEYDRWFDPVEEKGRQYYLTSVVEFLRVEEHLLALIEATDFLERVRQGWVEAMEQYDVTELIAMSDKTMCSNYLKQMYTNPSTRRAALGQLAGELIRRLEEEMRKWANIQPHSGKADAETGRTSSFSYYHFCECVPQIFSETYSDLRMLDVLEIDRWEDYLELLKTNLEFAGNLKKNWEFQEQLRGAAILAFLGADPTTICEWSELYGFNCTDWLIMEFCLKRLQEYLDLCRQPSCGPYRERIKHCGLRQLMEWTCDLAPLTVFSTIRNTILEYRKDLESYCRRIINSI